MWFHAVKSNLQSFSASKQKYDTNIVPQSLYLLKIIKLLLPQQIKAEVICNSYERESQIISYNLRVINLNLLK